jgi:hypothetical protein
MKEVRQNPMYRYLMVLTATSAIGLQGWQTLFNNFAVEVGGMEGKHIGVIQSVREIPGFLALLVVFVLLLIKEHRLSAVSIFCLGLGILSTGLFPSFIGLTLTTLLMSFGFHYYETTNQSLTLQYFDETVSPWVFGKQRSIGAASNIAIGILIFLVAPVPHYGDRPVGLFPRAHGKTNGAATKGNDLSKTILALLFPYLYGGCEASDLCSLCDISFGQKIPFLPSGGHHPLRG